MNAPGWVFLIGVLVTVAALAAYLIRISAILVHVNFTLGTVIAGVRAIASQVEPLGPVIGEINRDLGDVRGTLENVVARATRGRAGSRR